MPFAQQRRIAFGAQGIVVFLYLSQGLIVGLSLRREKFQNVENKVIVSFLDDVRDAEADVEVRFEDFGRFFGELIPFGYRGQPFVEQGEHLPIVFPLLHHLPDTFGGSGIPAHDNLVMCPLSPQVAGGVLVVESHQRIGIDFAQLFDAVSIRQCLDDGLATELFDRRLDAFVGLGQIAHVHAQGH